MKRRKDAERFSRPTAMRPARSTLQGPQIGLIGLAGMILVLVLSARPMHAESADSPDGVLPHVASPPPVAVTFSASADGTQRSHPADGAVDASVVPENADVAIDSTPPVGNPSRTALEELLIVRGFGASSWKSKTPDEVLAVAVANGNNPDLEPLNPFRKRSRDLFRTEHPLTIGDADMIVRLRLRAKARKAVSVEFHF